MKVKADIIKQSSIIALLRYSDFFLTMLLLQLGATELNIFWSFLEGKFYLLNFYIIAPIILFFFLKSYQKAYFRTFLIFNGVLIIYEIALIGISFFSV